MLNFKHILQLQAQCASITPTKYYVPHTRGDTDDFYGRGDGPHPSRKRRRKFYRTLHTDDYGAKGYPLGLFQYYHDYATRGPRPPPPLLAQPPPFIADGVVVNEPPNVPQPADRLYEPHQQDFLIDIAGGGGDADPIRPAPRLYVPPRRVAQPLPPTMLPNLARAVNEPQLPRAALREPQVRDPQALPADLPTRAVEEAVAVIAETPDPRNMPDDATPATERQNVPRRPFMTPAARLNLGSLGSTGQAGSSAQHAATPATRHPSRSRNEYASGSYTPWQPTVASNYSPYSPPLGYGSSEMEPFVGGQYVPDDEG